MAKIEIFFLNLKNKKTNSKFTKNVLLRGRATLSLLFEPKHNYVGPAVTEWIYEPVGLIRADFFGRRPISRPKIENFTVPKCFYFSNLHTRTKFQASRFNNKKKVPEGSRSP